MILKYVNCEFIPIDGNIDDYLDSTNYSYVYDVQNNSLVIGFGGVHLIGTLELLKRNYPKLSIYKSEDRSKINYILKTNFRFGGSAFTTSDQITDYIYDTGHISHK